MLLGQYPRSQGIGRVAWQHRHHRLRQNRTVVQLGRYLLHGYTCKLATGINGALVGTQPGKGWQKRRVNIDQPPGIAAHKAWRQNPHKAGQHDQNWLIRPIEPINQASQCRVKVLQSQCPARWQMKGPWHPPDC